MNISCSCACCYPLCSSLQPPFWNDDTDLQAAVARARPQLVEFLTHCPDWLLSTSQPFIPEATLSSLAGITDPREKISVLLDLLEKAGPAAWKHFAQSVCMEYDLPLDLEVLLLSSAGEGKRGQATFPSPGTANAWPLITITQSRQWDHQCPHLHVLVILGSTTPALEL